MPSRLLHLALALDLVCEEIAYYFPTNFLALQVVGRTTKSLYARGYVNSIFDRQSMLEERPSDKKRFLSNDTNCRSSYHHATFQRDYFSAK